MQTAIVKNTRKIFKNFLINFSVCIISGAVATAIGWGILGEILLKRDLRLAAKIENRLEQEPNLIDAKGNPMRPFGMVHRSKKLPYVFYPDREWIYHGHRVRTFRFDHSDVGFRGISTPIKKPKGEIRIVCIGDSHLASISLVYKETFPAILEEKLSHLFPRAKVINCGVPGYSINEIEVVLKDYGLKFSPDIVIYTAVCANDLDVWSAKNVLLPTMGKNERSHWRRVIDMLRDRNRSTMDRLMFVVSNRIRDLIKRNIITKNMIETGLREQEIGPLDPIWERWEGEKEYKHFEEVLSRMKKVCGSIPFIYLPDYIRFEGNRADRKIYVFQQRTMKIAGMLGYIVVDPYKFYWDFLEKCGLRSDGYKECLCVPGPDDYHPNGRRNRLMVEAVFPTVVEILRQKTQRGE